MAVCEGCGREMLDHVGCDITHWEWDEAPRVPYPSSEVRDCHDCGCPPGTLHHVGCDMERCAHCGGQLISCDCPIMGD